MNLREIANNLSQLEVLQLCGNVNIQQYPGLAFQESNRWLSLYTCMYVTNFVYHHQYLSILALKQTN